MNNVYYLADNAKFKIIKKTTKFKNFREALIKCYEFIDKNKNKNKLSEENQKTTILKLVK